MTKPTEKSNSDIQSELLWFQQLIMLRAKITFEQSLAEEEFQDLNPPDLSKANSPYAELVREHKMGFEERLILILGLIPHVRPSALDLLYMKNKLYDIPFTEFGGLTYDKHKGYMPTGETAVFILAGENLEKRFEVQKYFSEDHFFNKENILSLSKGKAGQPLLYGTLSVSRETISKVTLGEVFKPDFSENFPAKRIATEQEWDDLVLNDEVLDGIDQIKTYISHGKELKSSYEFGRKIRPGFKVLFTGPPGTGKTLTASLLGAVNKMDVYRIDLSAVVSKYIGETEKNLGRIFDMAENKDWILFFDEADALFGKRSGTTDAHDRYANQEVSFLLQRIEEFNGLVILCSNFKKNIDEAFFRRFNLVLVFDMPNEVQRRQLWNNYITDQFKYEDIVDIDRLASEHELSAASIVNVLHFSILKSLTRTNGKGNLVLLEDILSGIRIEKIKEGKSIF